MTLNNETNFVVCFFFSLKISQNHISYTEKLFTKSYFELQKKIVCPSRSINELFLSSFVKNSGNFLLFCSSFIIITKVWIFFLWLSGYWTKNHKLYKVIKNKNSHAIISYHYYNKIIILWAVSNDDIGVNIIWTLV